jgi:hypothetical protein
MSCNAVVGGRHRIIMARVKPEATGSAACSIGVCGYLDPPLAVDNRD